MGDVVNIDQQARDVNAKATASQPKPLLAAAATELKSLLAQIKEEEKIIDSCRQRIQELQNEAGAVRSYLDAIKAGREHIRQAKAMAKAMAKRK